MFTGIQIRQPVMAQKILFLLEQSLILCIIPDTEEGSCRASLLIGYRMTLQDIGFQDTVVVRNLPFIPLFFCKINIREHECNGIASAFIGFILNSGQLSSRLICPDTAIRRIKEKQRIIHSGSNIRQHAVQEPHRTVIKRKIEYQNTENTITDHGAVNW